MEEKIIDLRNKNEEEIMKAYTDISEDIEVQKIIWNVAQDYETARKVYIKYLDEKKRLYTIE